MPGTQLTAEEQMILEYIDEKIKAYNRATSHKPEYASDFQTSKQTLGTLAGDIRAGLHRPDEPVPLPEEDLSASK